MNELFSIKLEEKEKCNWCDKNAIAKSILKTSEKSTHEYYFCEEHLIEFHSNFYKYYNKVQAYLEFKQNTEKN